MHPLLAKPVEDPLRRPVRGRRVRQGGNRFLDAARIFEPHHLAARDAGGVGIDVAADAQQLASQLHVASGVVVEPFTQVSPGADVRDPDRLGIEVSLDAQLAPVFQLELEGQTEIATLPWAPSIGTLHKRRAGGVTRMQAVEAGHDGLLQG